MRIDPVYLVAPLPKPPSMPTRRAFLLASGAFVAGSAVGGACGYSMGVAARKPVVPVEGTPEPELLPSGDAELDELRRLAVKAPLDELFEKAIPFLSLRVHSYQTDPIVWQGVDRLSREIVENPARRVDQIVIAAVIGQIDGTARPAEPSLRDRVPELRRRRAEAKGK